MSGQATGWVLRHGPRVRAMRLVLLPIADAANANGEHAHPGLAAIIDYSLYERRHVLATIAQLIEEGWLEVEEEGGGRGRATVYRIPGVLNGPPNKGAASAPSPEGKGAVSDEKGCNPEPETVQPGDPSLSYATVTTNEENNARSEVTVEDQFALFWQRYPTRNGRKVDRPLALAAWRKLTLEERREAYRAVGAYRTACDEGLTIARDAHRWLRKTADGPIWEAWLHDPEPSARPGPMDFFAAAAEARAAEG